MKRLTLILAAWCLLGGTASAGVTGHRLVIPRMHLNMVLTGDLSDGPVAYFTAGGTIGIAGHRTTHLHPFYDIDKLVAGDRIFISGVGTWVVTRHAIVRDGDMWPLRYNGLVLSACTPKGSAAFRWVVFARKVGSV